MNTVIRQIVRHLKEEGRLARELDGDGAWQYAGEMYSQHDGIPGERWWNRAEHREYEHFTVAWSKLLVSVK